MAKKATTTPANKSSFSFMDLAKKLSKINPDSEILTAETKSIKIENWISTGNYMLNALISGSIYKGIPEGRITILAGEEASGKTFLALNIAREALKQGYKLIWIDTENAMDDLTFQRFGIDLNSGNVIRVPIDIIENVVTYLANLADNLLEAQSEGKEIEKYLVVLDSLGQLSTIKEVTDAKSGSDKADMTRAKEIKRLFRVCTKRFGQLKIPMIITNHIYASIGFISQSIQGGGCLVPDTKIRMASGRNKKIKNIKLGDFVETLAGPKEVIETFEYKKPIIKFYLDDGTIFECTEEHKFLIQNEPEKIWKSAKDLNENDEIFSII